MRKIFLIFQLSFYLDTALFTISSIVMLNCIVIDDEQFSVEAILKYIELIPNLNVAGVYTDPVQALSAVSASQDIDLLFMDVDMPSLSGLELAKALRSKTQKLIFTTAHSKYAFEAYEADGDAFLLKPYTFGRFSMTINRLFPVKSDQYGNSDYFLVKSKEDDLAIVRVKFDEVIGFESAQNYVKIYLSNNTVLTAYLTLKDVAQLVRSRPEFVQFHRAFIISIRQIGHIRGNTVQMNNGISFNVGDSYKENFGAFLENKLLVTSRGKH